jgi:hypothetical protein
MIAAGGGGGDLGIGGAISESADGLLRKIGIAAADGIVSALAGLRDRREFSLSAAGWGMR